MGGRDQKNTRGGGAISQSAENMGAFLVSPPNLNFNSKAHERKGKKKKMGLGKKGGPKGRLISLVHGGKAFQNPPKIGRRGRA